MITNQIIASKICPWSLTKWSQSVDKKHSFLSFINEGFGNNGWVSELTDHQFSPSTEGKR